MLDTNLFLSRYKSYNRICFGLGINDKPLRSKCCSMFDRVADDKLTILS